MANFRLLAFILNKVATRLTIFYDSGRLFGLEMSPHVKNYVGYFNQVFPTVYCSDAS